MPPRNFTDEEEAEIAKIYLSGVSAKRIMRAYGHKYHISFTAALRRQGVEQRPPPERNRLYKIDAHAFDVIDNEEKAYWWGFIYADGYVRKRSLAVTLKLKDKDQLVQLKRFLKSEHPIKEIFNNCSNGKKYKAILFFATDRHLINRLRILGIVPKRTNFNQAIQHLPKELERHWIRGYFDGDGSARKPNATRGASLVFCGSCALMEWIRKVIADATGTNPNLKVTKHSIAKLWYLYFSGNRVAHNVTNWMYQDAIVWMPRKKKVVDDWPLPKERNKRRDAKGRYA